MTRKRFLALALLCCLVFTTACGAQTATPAPGGSTQSDSLPEEDAKQIATDLIRRYKTYTDSGVCCDYAVSTADLSAYAPEGDFPYFVYQYRLLCCQTLEQYRAHVLQVMAPSLVQSRWENYLFSDNTGNLYMKVALVDRSTWEDPVLVEYSSDTIVATVAVMSVGGESYELRFTLKHNGTNFVIFAVEDPTQPSTEPSTEPTESVTEPTESVTEPTQPTEPQPTEPSLPLVTDQAHSSTYPACIHIPQVNLPNNAAANVNATLRNQFDEEGALVSYHWAVKGNIVSILVRVSQLEYDYINYYAFNVDTTTGKFATKAQVAALYNTTEAGMQTQINAALRTYWDSADRSAPAWKDFETQTFAEENLQAAEPFIQENGKLGFVCLVYVPAGSGRMPSIFDLETGTQLSFTPCSIH